MDSVTGQWFRESSSENPWFKDVFPDFRHLKKEELPEGMDSGIGFTTVCINTGIYLPYLASQCLKNGVVLKRAIISHISEAAEHHHSGKKADVIVNCTGLLASKLGGVMDRDVIPTRGQIVLVRNDPGIMLSTSGTDDGPDELCYIMHRAAGGGTILGGTYQKGNTNGEPDMATAERIMKRAVELCPALTGGKGIEALSVIRHGVGLRPLRTSGVRIEKEKINGTWVVHNYGHGGWGYQGSYGCAEGAKELVDEVAHTKAKL
jgi:D-amino-acid oxidase